MDQKIFETGLSTEAISAYLLCRGLADAGMDLRDENLLEKWNGTVDAFYQSMAALENRNIIQKTDAAGGDKTAYVLTESTDWDV